MGFQPGMLSPEDCVDNVAPWIENLVQAANSAEGMPQQCETR